MSRTPDEPLPDAAAGAGPTPVRLCSTIAADSCGDVNETIRDARIVREP
jgi:hypothetical protein